MSTSESAPTKKIIICLTETENSPTMMVSVECLKKSENLKAMLEEDLEEDLESPLMLPNIKSKEVWQKVYEYMEYMCKSDYPTAERTGHIKEFTDYEKKYLESMGDHKMLKDVILTANFLDIRALVELGCKQIAEMLKGKTPDEVRSMFGLPPKEAAEAAEAADDSDEAVEKGDEAADDSDEAVEAPDEGDDDQ